MKSESWETWWAGAQVRERQLLLDMADSPEASALATQPWEQIPDRTRHTMMVMGPPDEQLAAVDPDDLGEGTDLPAPPDAWDEPVGGRWPTVALIVCVALLLIVVLSNVRW